MAIPAEEEHRCERCLRRLDAFDQAHDCRTMTERVDALKAQATERLKANPPKVAPLPPRVETPDDPWSERRDLA